MGVISSQTMSDPEVAAGPGEPAEVSEETVVFFKKPKTRANIRKRPRDDGDGAADQEEGGTGPTGSSGPAPADDATGGDSAVVKKKKEGDGKGIAATTKRDREKEALGVKFATTGTAELAGDEGATRTLELDDMKGRAGNTSSQKGLRAGPQRAPAHLRVNARFDYQPDICKDYKETGYCGYGDSCKFLHDRGDYKAGWQLDREWDEEQKRKEKEAANKYLVEEDREPEEEPEEELPFACAICRGDFKDPVVTKCGHFFCQNCAIQQHRKSPKCFLCGAATLGIFKMAKDLEVKLAERKKRMAEKEAEAREMNERLVSDQERESDEEGGSNGDGDGDGSE
ncbi:hypothetical protein DFJ74DRAFT_618558 [Hyaloraphidium curvatum]|nr:hypothetical protein DFJ74DRAFT_618558 [Hyaloraphidium curvatum]